MHTQTANAVSEMHYSAHQFEEAETCCKLAIAAATECKQFGLVVRLYCNRAAASRGQDK